MNWIIGFVFVGLYALVSSVPDYYDYYEERVKKIEPTMLEKQKKVLSLFLHINQPSYYPEHIEIVNISASTQNKKHPNYATLGRYADDFINGSQLPKEAIFSVNYPEHLDEAIALCNIFYQPDDFSTFYKTAVLARHWVNEGLFLYSVSIVIIHRPDCYGIIIPPIYEIYPWYFFNKETIQSATKYTSYKQIWDGKTVQATAGGYSGYTILSNYSTKHYLALHPDQSVSYYLEDVGINSFYYTYNLYYPIWMHGWRHGIKHDRRGHLYYFVHQQLLARYYLERLSNGMGAIGNLDFSEPVRIPYVSFLQYPNGLNFPERPTIAKVSDYNGHFGTHFGYSYATYRDYERRVADAIDNGYALSDNNYANSLYDNDGYNVIGNLLQCNPDSVNQHYYGPWLGYGRHIMGYSPNHLNKDEVVPSALEHDATCLRDPAFYQLYKHLMVFYYKYQSRFAPYSREDLTLPGVEIKKVEIDPLITYFDEFYSELSQNAYYLEKEIKNTEKLFFVRAKQYRLNHKPFTYKIYVKSDQDTKAMVKIFIGPKYDEHGRDININVNRYNFFELDKFVYELKTGENFINRSSNDSFFFGPDKTTYNELYKQVLGAIEGKNQFNFDNNKQNYFFFPQRYMLPKGTAEGLSFQFYFIVYPFKPYEFYKPQEWTYSYPRPGKGGPIIDDYSVFYPFDRPIKNQKMFYQDIPNSFFYETKIFHKSDKTSVVAEN